MVFQQTGGCEQHVEKWSQFPADSVVLDVILREGHFKEFAAFAE